MTDRSKSKFDSALAETMWTLMLDGLLDAEYGDPESFGFIGLAGDTLMVVSNDGFVTADRMESPERAHELFHEAVTSLGMLSDDGEE